GQAPPSPQPGGALQTPSAVVQISPEAQLSVDAQGSPIPPASGGAGSFSPGQVITQYGCPSPPREHVWTVGPTRQAMVWTGRPVQSGWPCSGVLEQPMASRSRAIAVVERWVSIDADP